MSHPEFKTHTIPVINQRSINAVCELKGFHISYNPSSADYGSKTTAIVFGGSLFFVLNGDHRQALFDVAQVDQKQGCIDYFINNIKLSNSKSEHHVVIGKLEDLFGLTKLALKHLGQPNIDRITQATGL